MYKVRHHNLNLNQKSPVMGVQFSFKYVTSASALVQYISYYWKYTVRKVIINQLNNSAPKFITRIYSSKHLKYGTVVKQQNPLPVFWNIGDHWSCIFCGRIPFFFKNVSASKMLLNWSNMFWRPILTTAVYGFTAIMFWYPLLI